MYQKHSLIIWLGVTLLLEVAVASGLILPGAQMTLAVWLAAIPWVAITLYAQTRAGCAMLTAQSPGLRKLLFWFLGAAAVLTGAGFAAGFIFPTFQMGIWLIGAGAVSMHLAFSFWSAVTVASMRDNQLRRWLTVEPAESAQTHLAPSPPQKTA